jgi:hypothetical protein
VGARTRVRAGVAAELSGLQKVERRALLALKGRFQLDNLLHFNRKFFPSWQRRFVVYERKRDLPRVGIAALAAEAYLPFSGRKHRPDAGQAPSTDRRPVRPIWRHSPVQKRPQNAR